MVVRMEVSSEVGEGRVGGALMVKWRGWSEVTSNGGVAMLEANWCDGETGVEIASGEEAEGFHVLVFREECW